MITDPHPSSIDRLYDLLAARATVGLPAADANELTVLLARWPHVDPDEFDRAAAAVHLTGVDPHAVPPVPPKLLAKLHADADAHFGRPVASAAGPAVGTLAGATVPLPPERFRRSAAFYWAVCGWSCAATVLVGFLVLQFVRPPRDRRSELTVVQKRDRLAADATAVRYASAANADAPSGKVVFSASKQEGYLELRGLKPNDPTRTQYQLWVVDKGRPHKEPVDGGVFDVNPDGTALVPVRSPLVLRDVAAFAVTEEPPGGVVVSEDGKRGKFVVLMTPEVGP